MERIYTTESVNKIGETVLLKGWVETIRNHGMIIFIMLQDTKGVIQCVGDNTLENISEGYVLEIEGKVKARPENMVNKGIETGTVEIEIEKMEVLSKSKELPIPLNTSGYEINEEMRLKYRYLDLRRNRVRKIFKLRSEFFHNLRLGLIGSGFTEIETPMLTKGTKEGAKNFIVPSRYNPGKFYALPQSPQQYKQLLMTAGVEKYFQFARCIRDEDLRADRGYEFTQLDIEMSFVKQEDVLSIMGRILKDAILAVGGKVRDEVFPVISYEDAIKKYGGDKFDVRTEEEKKNGVLAFVWVNRFPFYKNVEDDYEKGDSKSKWVFTHNPFSSPIPEHIEKQLKMEDIGSIIADQYDLVCNGYEIGSGGIRAHNPELLKKTFEIMGYSGDEIEENIGHMLKAFELGTPPHGGLAFGLDRLVMLLANESSLKEVIPFPMTSKGSTAVMDAPSEVSETDLENLHLEVTLKGPKVRDQILSKLKDSGVEYKYLEHEEVRTSEESARVRGTKLSDGAKAMILRSKEYENKLIMIVIPADKQLDLDVVGKTLGEEYEICPKDIVEKRTGILMGGVPPFGRILGIDLYFDKTIGLKEVVAFNCGLRTSSIIMKGSDLVKLAQPDKKITDVEFTS